MYAVKKKSLVPGSMGSCHTTAVDKTGMRKLDGTLITYDFSGRSFSKD